MKSVPLVRKTPAKSSVLNGRTRGGIFHADTSLQREETGKRGVFYFASVRWQDAHTHHMRNAPHDGRQAAQVALKRQQERLREIGKVARQERARRVLCIGTARGALVKGGQLAVGPPALPLPCAGSVAWSCLISALSGESSGLYAVFRPWKQGAPHANADARALTGQRSADALGGRLARHPPEQTRGSICCSGWRPCERGRPGRPAACAASARAP